MGVSGATERREDVGGEVQGGPAVDRAPTPRVEQNRDLALPFGVLARENPDAELKTTLHRNWDTNRYEPYNGVQVGLNYFGYLLRATQKAKEDGVDVHPVGFGYSRVGRELEGDPDRIRKVLNGNGTDDEQRFFERIRRSEQIRACIMQAAGEVLGLPQFKSFILSTELVRDDEGARDRILRTSTTVMDKVRDKTSTINFFGLPTTFEFGFSRGLPEKKRPDTSKLTGENVEYSYLAAEVALVLELIRKRRLKYLSYVGSDKAFKGVGGERINQEIMHTECLREAVIQGFPEKTDLASAWEMDPALDGLGAYSNGSSSGVAKRVGPYYLEARNVDPSAEEKGKAPLIIPGFPWRQSFLKIFMADGGGGLAGGQVAGIVKGSVKPLFGQYLQEANLERARARFSNDGNIVDRKFDSLAAWARGEESGSTSRAIPAAFEGIGDFNDAVRILCQHISERAIELVQALPA